MKINRIRTVISVLFLLILVSGISYCSYNFITAETRVRALCAEIPQGMSLASLREFSLSHGLAPVPYKSGVNYIVETKTFGRFGCKVTIDADVIKVVEFHFAD